MRFAPGELAFVTHPIAVLPVGPAEKMIFLVRGNSGRIEDDGDVPGEYQVTLPNGITVIIPDTHLSNAPE